MRRGFKAEAERVAARHRAEYGTCVRDRLDPIGFLKSKGLIVLGASEVPRMSDDDLHQLLEVDGKCWSGLTVREAGHTAVIFNDAHHPHRQASTLMHEWAHIELRHRPSRADRAENGILLLSDYPAELEEEADWLGGAMLLPRDGLLHHCSRGLSVEEVAKLYGVSIQLAQWRIGKTGVARQLGRRRYG